MKFPTIRVFAVLCALALGVVAPQVRANLSDLKSSAVLIMDEQTGEVLYSRNQAQVLPIASITKLMTAMVTLDAGLPLDERITITNEDLDTRKGTGSRLRVGTELSRDDLLRLALMASENRAASALGGAYPGGRDAFVTAMNMKARQLGMTGTLYVEPTGLSSANVSTAEDLAKLVRVAQTYPLIREYSTLPHHSVPVGTRMASFSNTNGLVRAGNWEIGLQKTGYISEAGRCLVMQAKLAARSVVIVLLDSWGKYTRIADANRIRQWLEPDFVIPVQPKKITRAKSRSRIKATRSKSVKVVRTSNGRLKATIKRSAK
ncbi:MAG TPA: D-alanyl-D-alanine endopeptidase [Burkholderiales bacterium]|nr:D-alanyl-D-alanine endopeptidase [Burkholderiales bacterium]